MYEKPTLQRFGTFREITQDISGPVLGDTGSGYHRS